jgi:hypothetical protein
VASGEDVASAIGQVAPVLLPQTLAERSAVRQAAIGVVPGIAVYGEGLSAFVVLALPGRVGNDALETARRAGGKPVVSALGSSGVTYVGPGEPTADPMVVLLDGGYEGYELRADMLTAVLVRPLTGDERGRRRTYLLAGLVEPQLLHQAANELLAGAL